MRVGRVEFCRISSTSEVLKKKESHCNSRALFSRALTNNKQIAYCLYCWECFILASISEAKPSVTPFPFTTLHPNVGLVKYKDLRRISVADTPGLIEGAHDNVGLGHRFLRHIERTKMLAYVTDVNGFQLNQNSPIRLFWKKKTNYFTENFNVNQNFLLVTRVLRLLKRRFSFE